MSNGSGSLTESVRQYEASLAEKQRQYDSSLAERQRQYDASLAQRRSSSSDSGSSGSRSGSTGYSPSDQKAIVSALEQYKKDYDKASSDGEAQSDTEPCKGFSLRG